MNIAGYHVTDMRAQEILTLAGEIRECSEDVAKRIKNGKELSDLVDASDVDDRIAKSIATKGYSRSLELFKKQRDRAFAATQFETVPKEPPRNHPLESLSRDEAHLKYAF